MRILKITGKDEESVKNEIMKEYGDNAIIVNSSEERKTGLLGLFKKGDWSITIALDESNTFNFSRPTTSDIQDEAIEEGADFIKQLDNLKSPFPEPKIKVDNIQLSMQPTKNIEDTIISEEKIPFEKILKQSMLEEGIEESIIDDILDQVSENTVDGISRALYNTLTSVMPKFNYNIPRVTFFVGSTGVGKTTTIAKLTAIKVLEENKKVVLLTADTYRIAAVAQLKTYAEILNVEIETIFEPSDIPKYLQKWKDADYIFIDTAGRSHKDFNQLGELKELLATVEEKQVFLVLNMNTQYKDIQSIVPIYKNLVDRFALIITKLDETDGIGNLLNIASCTKTEIAYITTGQNVPEDIEKFETLKYVRLLLGRIKYE
ncbi:flagellar biosynthesis protein FlhF [Candidatus Epulonipiscium viviparus]|uniref:flagellar biosynthesis protein FlhF n=1 Tax=Candidatus Epulonipiscium viviparus TaxID=420336 RepID=UPI0027381079|nr:flagellar biosynthesis protein FlhF [Candidatus Epulopiscium viviparus]